MIPLFNFMIAEGDKKDKQRTDPAIHQTEKAKKKKDPATSYVRRGKPNYLRRGSA